MQRSPTSMSLRRLPGGAGEAPIQLAGGEAMLAEAAGSGVPAMRWYSFDPPALLLGSGQRLDEVDREACAHAGVAVYRRGSGGGAVLSSGLLLLDLALPRTHHLFRADVTESYRWLGAAWSDALRALGLPAAPVGIAAARADSARLDPLLKRVCFGGLSPYEVVVGGRKVVGLAQRRRHGGALFQSALYLRWQPRATAALLCASPAEREQLGRQLAERAAGLDSFSVAAGDPRSAVVAAVESALHEAFTIRE